jgi:hypothetical protein
LAAIEYVTYFVGQIENFAKYARRQVQNIRILRESIFETAPTRDMASFVFQMHIEAQHAIEVGQHRAPAISGCEEED